ncbi:AbrB/MazE/SpoVT family DNA-binding domain-containing protein [Desmospora profundinema]|uniref:Antitoxin MazE n=1 Tax=Desmospora profundinema TaxID=1571184 RepID=A0ABU1IQN3_9BACL|nr:AbrB/MazE/SpoVT family DNA-binding domain-containing protein [Desmospora profundinema]MDR6227033.1 antitoxin MazE [Desmospora profundinema]
MGVKMSKNPSQIRTVGRMGNTTGVSVPSEFLDKMRLKRGDKIEVSYDEQRNEIRIRPVRTLPEGVSEDFLRTLDAVLTERDQVFKNLKDR